MFNNLNQLKKGLKAGMKFQIDNRIKNYTAIREVVEVQTNGFYATGDDVEGKKLWVEYPKAKECEFNNDGFIFKKVLIYKYI